MQSPMGLFDRALGGCLVGFLSVSIRVGDVSLRAVCFFTFLNPFGRPPVARLGGVSVPFLFWEPFGEQPPSTRTTTAPS